MPELQLTAAHCLVLELQITARYQGSSSVPSARALVHYQVPGFKLTACRQSFSSLPGNRVPAQCLVPEIQLIAAHCLVLYIEPQLTARYQGSSSVPGARTSVHCLIPGFQLIVSIRVPSHSQVSGFLLTDWCQLRATAHCQYQSSISQPGSRVSAQCLVPAQSYSSLPVSGFCLTARYQGFCSLPGASPSAKAHCQYQGFISLPGTRVSTWCHRSSLLLGNRFQLTTKYLWF